MGESEALGGRRRWRCGAELLLSAAIPDLLLLQQTPELMVPQLLRGCLLPGMVSFSSPDIAIPN